MTLTPRQLARQATNRQLSINDMMESKPDSEVTSGQYLGYDGGYQFKTSNGGIIRVDVLSTQEPAIGESYLLEKDSTSDRMIVKPKPRL